MDVIINYYPSHDQLNILLKEAVIVFDTCALLELYHYRDATQSNIINNVFAHLKNRLWLPHQVMTEYLNNREHVANKPIKSYKRLIYEYPSDKESGDMIRIKSDMEEMIKKQKELSGKINTLKEKLSTQDKHPYCDTNIFIEIVNAEKTLVDSLIHFKMRVEEVDKSLTDLASDREDEIVKSLEADIILKAITDYFTVGDEFTFDDLMQIVKEGSFRYSKTIPPGYEDVKGKVGLQVYGDLILWKQILNYASKNERSVILVSNEKKSDWLDNRNVNKPRFELLKEFNNIANNFFWMYNLSLFLYSINEALTDINISDDVLLEVKQQQTKGSLQTRHSLEIINNGWKEVYTSFIQENPGSDPEHTYYSIVHINDDDVPELVIDYSITAEGGAILNYFNGELDVEFISAGGIKYIEKENLFMQSSGRMGHYDDTVYSVQNGKVIVLHRGTWGENESSKSLVDENSELTYYYYWDDHEVSKEEYKVHLSSAFDSEGAKETYSEAKSASEIIDIISCY